MESSRDYILNSLGEIEKPILEPLYDVEHIKYYDRVDKFISSVKGAGAKIYNDKKNFTIQNIFKDAKITIDTSYNSKLSFKNIKNVDLTILRGSFGVAENGAIWIEWRDDLYPRALLTISKYLIVLLKRSQIVNNMREAYDLIDFSDVSYGIFLSGPSKTADIEQSLVIGAHGALDMAIVLED